LKARVDGQQVAEAANKEQGTGEQHQ
jgi:hypothetical protein